MRASAGEPSVEVAIVNTGASVAAARAAAAYRASEGVRARVTVVDNGSSEAERETLLRLCEPPVRVHLSPTNRGFGGAASLVLDASDADLVCVSNEDLVPDRRMLAELADVVLGDARVGVAGPRYDAAAAHYHAELPTPASLLVRPLLGSFGHRAVRQPGPGQVAEVDQPAGACLLARREVWQAFGGFDTGFFLWYEDVDLARRLRQAGYRNVVVGSAVATHQGGQTTSRIGEAARQEIRLRSLERYIARHHPRLMPLARISLALGRLTRVRLVGRLRRAG